MHWTEKKLRLDNYIELSILAQRIKEGYITYNYHPGDKNLVIYNYTRKCQIDWVWDETICKCRGLICYKEFVISRPFDKFFEFEFYTESEIATRLNEEIEITEKLDGSLGISYYVNEDLYGIATTASFVSEQALHATALLKNKYKLSFLPTFKEYCKAGETFLFEIIYPENRIVVDYGKEDDIILLSIKRNVDGTELRNQQIKSLFGNTLKVVNAHDPIKDLRYLKDQNKYNEEGYVFRFIKDNFRIKIKFERYISIHRTTSNLFLHRIWDILYQKKDINEYLNTLDDDIVIYVSREIDLMIKNYRITEILCMLIYKEYLDTYGKCNINKGRHFYEWCLTKDIKYLPILQGLFHGRDYSESLLKLIKPKNRRIFE